MSHFRWFNGCRVGAFRVALLVLSLVTFSESPASAQSDLTEVSFWESVRDSTDPAEFEAYLAAFPDGAFAPLARIRLRRLTGQGDVQTSDTTDDDLLNESGGPAPRLLHNMDADRDGRISREEWTSPPRAFSAMDENDDGFVTAGELNAFVSQMPRGNRPAWSKSRGPGVGSGQGLQAGMGRGLDGQIPPMRIDADTKCAFLRGTTCDIALAVGRGLFETGLSPRFPPGLRCRGIDDGYAIDYTGRRDRRAYHGGIDIPAPFGTSIVVAASGVVVSKSEGERGRRGREVILRHSPDDTGLPVWTYTQYAHLDEMPELAIGQHVEMGNVIGPTGNSGNGSERRRPAVHFAAWFSEIPAFAIVASVVIPVDGRWMDPIALYRGGSPFDSAAMKALSGNEKQVDIPVMIEDGSVFPPGTKVIWPYACARS